MLPNSARRHRPAEVLLLRSCNKALPRKLLPNELEEEVVANTKLSH